VCIENVYNTFYVSYNKLSVININVPSDEWFVVSLPWLKIDWEDKLL